MNRPTEMDIVIYSMSAEMNPAYSQSNIGRRIHESALLWAQHYASLTEDQLCEKAVELTHQDIRDMNWEDDDIEGVAWFLGIYTRIILNAGLSNSFATIMTKSMRKYFNL